jgi:hypothetical protein
MKKVLKIIGSVFLVLFAIGFIGSFMGDKTALNVVQHETDHLYNHVAEDQQKAFEIAKNSGNMTDAYVQAGIVAAAYLQAKDDVNYNKWKEIEKGIGKKLGMPNM